jgi:hypothetical protein
MDREEVIEMILNPGRRPAEGSAEHRAFLAYLDRFPDCKAMYQQQEAVWGALDLWEDVEPSPAFDGALRARLEQPTGLAGWRASFEAWAAGLRPAAVVGVAALVLISGILVSWRPESGALSLAPAESAAIEQIDQALDDIEMLADFDVLLAPSGTPGES